MNKLNFVSFALLILFSLNFLFALDQSELQSTAQKIYLINPLDNSEIISESYATYLNNIKIWTIKTNESIFAINDKNYNIFVNDEQLINTTKTYLFYSKLNSQNNKKIAYFFNTIPESTNNYNYNIQLILKQLETNNELDNNVYVALSNIQTRVKEIGIISNSLTQELINLDSNLANPIYENYSDIKTLGKNIKKDIEDIQKKQYEISQSNNQLLIILIDANISNEMKTIIPTQTQSLPQSFNSISEYISYINTNLEKIDNAIITSENIDFDKLKENWNSRLNRIPFLTEYLKTDDIIFTKTKKNNAKELFDLILAKKDIWKNLDKTKAFITAYNKMYLDIQNREYDNARRQIKPLKDVALEIYSNGEKIIQSTTTEIVEQEQEEQTNNIITYFIIGLAIIICFYITFKIVKKIKNDKENKNENKDNEINIDFK